MRHPDPPHPSEESDYAKTGEIPTSRRISSDVVSGNFAFAERQAEQALRAMQKGLWVNIVNLLDEGRHDGHPATISDSNPPLKSTYTIFSINSANKLSLSFNNFVLCYVDF